MIKYLLTAIAGIAVGAIATHGNNEKEESKEKDSKFFVNLRTDKFSKPSLEFTTYAGAKKMFDRISKKKTVSFNDVVDYCPSEMKLYLQWKKEGNIGKDNYPTLSTISKVSEIYFGSGNEVFEQKTF